MSQWGWSPARTRGIWQHGAICLRPLVASAPYLTLLVLLATLFFAGNALTLEKGVLFELPPAGGVMEDGEVTKQVAVVIPMGDDTLVFFDDGRYVLNDSQSASAFSAHLADRIAKSGRKSLLILADRRIPGGELMGLAALARKGGAEKVLFAEKRSGATE